MMRLWIGRTGGAVVVRIIRQQGFARILGPGGWSLAVFLWRLWPAFCLYAAAKRSSLDASSVELRSAGNTFVAFMEGIGMERSCWRYFHLEQDALFVRGCW